MGSKTVRARGLVALRLTMIPLACGSLIFMPLSVTAQQSQPETAATDPTGRPVSKSPIRHPGAATGQHGGVGPQSVSELPAGTATVRSPGGAPAGNRSVDLDSLQSRVLERVNLHREVAGLTPVAAEPRLLRAAQSHSNYLDSANQMGHYEDKKTNPFYTGNSPFDRIDAVRYNYAEAGEVVARQPSSHPAAAVDALMTAIYHRFIMLSPDFVQAGPGVVLKAHQGAELLNVTVDFGAETLPSLAPPSTLTVYPAPGQTGVPVDFDPAEEFPNPMPGHTLVGYPISVQVDARYALAVSSFQLYEAAPYSGRRLLDAKLLTHDADQETPAHAAALIPISPLAPGTIYQLVFSGSVNGASVSKSWQFMTAPESAVTMRFASSVVTAGATQEIVLEGLDTEKGPYYLCYAPAQLVQSLVHVTETQIAMTTATGCDPNSKCDVNVSASYKSCAKPFAGGTFSIAQ